MCFLRFQSKGVHFPKYTYCICFGEASHKYDFSIMLKDECQQVFASLRSKVDKVKAILRDYISLLFRDLIACRQSYQLHSVYC